MVAQELQREFLDGAPVADIIGDIRQAISEQHGLQVHRAVLVKPGGIPRTSSGKIQRRLCRSMFEAGQLDEVARG